MVSATAESIWALLQQVEDPEIPVLNVVEMGIVRDVSMEADGITVAITPTYSGCPAMDAIADNIVSHLHAQGFSQVRVKTVYAPPWTSDWITEEAREKLRDYGIAPPAKKACGASAKPWLEGPSHAGCPFCRSGNTELRSEFGSTACKALHFCNTCHQPFEHFKCI